MTSETTSRHFDWNHADQLAAFATQTGGAEPSVHAHYLYDAAGQRVKKLVRRQGGQVEVTHYLGGFEHHRWGPVSNPAANNHVHVSDDQQRIALVRLGPAHPDDRSPAVQYHLGDHLASSNVVVDDDRRPDQPRGIHPLRGDQLRQLHPQALPVHRQGTRRGKRPDLSRRTIPRGVDGPNHERGSPSWRLPAMEPVLLRARQSDSLHRSDRQGSDKGSRQSRARSGFNRQSAKGANGAVNNVIAAEGNMTTAAQAMGAATTPKSAADALKQYSESKGEFDAAVGKALQLGAKLKGMQNYLTKESRILPTISKTVQKLGGDYPAWHARTVESVKTAITAIDTKVGTIGRPKSTPRLRPARSRRQRSSPHGAMDQSGSSNRNTITNEVETPSRLTSAGISVTTTIFNMANAHSPGEAINAAAEGALDYMGTEIGFALAGPPGALVGSQTSKIVNDPVGCAEAVVGCVFGGNCGDAPFEMWDAFNDAGNAVVGCVFGGNCGKTAANISDAIFRPVPSLSEMRALMQAQRR